MSVDWYVIPSGTVLHSPHGAPGYPANERDEIADLRRQLAAALERIADLERTIDDYRR